MRTERPETERAARIDETPIVELRHVSKVFGQSPGIIKRIVTRLSGGGGVDGARPPGAVQAVDDVDLVINRGEAVGLVGESGCGKSTLGRLVTGHLHPTSGEVLIEGRSRNAMSRKEQRQAKLKIQMIFQDPFSSLNPRMKVSDIIAEAPLVHGFVRKREIGGYVDEQLRRTGLDPSVKTRYPHQFSGGQRQRIGIARALAVQPEFLICDEAVASLDVSIQAQIINLVMELRRDLDLTYLFISHDLGVVEHLCDRVVVMYLGRIVEEAPVEDLFERTNHPYTKSLLANVPRIDARATTYHTIKGEIPSPTNPPSGCHFHPRCPFAMPHCSRVVPELLEIAPGHRSACHLNTVADADTVHTV